MALVEEDPRRPRTTSLWLALIALLFIAFLVWLLDPLGWAGETEPAGTATPAAEWTAAPEEPGVPVTLPQAPVEAVPAAPGEEPTPEVTATGAEP